MKRRKKILPTAHDWLLLSFWLFVCYLVYRQDSDVASTILVSLKQAVQHLTGLALSLLG